MKFLKTKTGAFFLGSCLAVLLVGYVTGEVSLVLAFLGFGAFWGWVIGRLVRSSKRP